MQKLKEYKYIILIFVAIILFLAVGTSWLLGYKILNPEAWTCQLKGGKWEWGVKGFGQNGCLYQYSDGGKACIQKSDCQGGCVILNGANNNQEGYLVGQCKNNSLPLAINPGCFGYIGDGSGKIISDTLDKPIKFDAKKLEYTCY